MTTMDKEVQNRKLAEWAGFKYGKWLVPNWDGSVSSEPYCIYPDGVESYEPDFTESPDTCFKWLVPKVKGVTTLTNSYKGWAVSINLGDSLITAGGNGETPALAICLAILKLIEKDIDK